LTSVEEIVEELSYLERKVLLALQDLKTATPEQIRKEGKFKELVEVMNASSWLRSKNLVTIEERPIKRYTLAKKKWATKNLPERRALKLLRKRHGVLTLDELKKSGKVTDNEVPIAIGWMKKKGWATLEKEEGMTVIKITDKGKESVSTVGKDEELVRKLADGEMTERDVDPLVIKMLKSRKDVVREKETIRREIGLTEMGREAVSMGVELKEEVAQLTPELLSSGKWKDVHFRRYDVGTFAPSLYGGKKHPLNQYIEKIRKVFSEMGFSEIGGDFVELAFWDFDALFQPQDHPARDMQDTFYTVDPDMLQLPPEDLVKRIKDMHERGGDIGSDGWGYDWNVDLAKQAILRTHTTVNSIRYLSEHPDPPVKIFTIGRIFRRETITWKHLPEFQQVEGIVMEKKANLGMLIGILKEFYRKMGFEKVRVRPAFFPYTEPSMEVEVYFKGEWMELGGSGIFRPEVTEPFGVKHPVLAWGLGLERLMMVNEGIDDIRDIYVSDMDWLRNSKLPRL
jgi:phenylalanyl-tRNA synthetase alpha chain